MLDRTAEQFKVAPSRLVADAGYGSAEMLGWMVDGRGIEPHVKLMDKSERTDGALSRSDFAFRSSIVMRIQPRRRPALTICWPKTGRSSPDTYQTRLLRILENPMK
jgi:hypothetical protein